MKNTALVVALTLAVAVNLAAQPKKPQKWSRADTPHFTFFSGLSEGTTRGLATKLETLHALIEELDPTRRPTSPRPFVIYLFKGDRTFKPFWPIWEGKPKPVSWIARHSFEATYVAVDAAQWDNAAEGIYNAYALEVFDSRFFDQPLWVRYGLSEYYGTFKTEGKNLALGLPDSRHLERLREGLMIPMDRLLAADHRTPMVNKAPMSHHYRAEVWVLVHYLIHGGERQGQLATFIGLVKQMPPEEAFQRAFNVEPKKLAGELRAYVAQRLFGYSRFPRDQFQVAQGFTWSAMPWDETLCRLGDLRLHVDDSRTSEAEPYYRAALAENPEQGGAYTGIGAMAYERERYEDALAPLKKAIALDPDDYRAHLLYGRSLLRGRQIGRQWWNELSEETRGVLLAARASFQRCTELQSELAVCWRGLGSTYFWDRKPTEGARALERALSLDPAREDVALNLMQLYAYLGEVDAAQRLYGSYLQRFDQNQIARAHRHLERARDYAGQR